MYLIIFVLFIRPILSPGPTGPVVRVATALCSAVFGSVTFELYGLFGCISVVQKTSLKGAKFTA